MEKTQEELKELNKKTETISKKSNELTEKELANISGGTDTESLRVSGKPVPLPEAKSKKESDGGYAGNIPTDSPKA